MQVDEFQRHPEALALPRVEGHKPGQGARFSHGFRSVMVLRAAMRSFGIGALAILVTSSACSRAEGDVRVWRPGDHDQAPSQTQEPTNVGQVASSTAAPNNSAVPQSPEAVWSSLCAGCHGQMGQGDGPMGATVAARNLSDPRWQAAVADEQIAATILHGKGRMPAFSLKPDVLKGLVDFIRAHVRKKIDE